jgi:uncharacterized protein (TIGR02302 family)
LRLARALRRAQWAIVWERIWPHLARVLTIAGFFLAVSWAGLWTVLPLTGRLIGMTAFGFLMLAALGSVRLRWPTRNEALHRLDHKTGLRHRPATALTDTLQSSDPVSMALWQAQRERTLAALQWIRAGLPSPRLAIHDPWALRALVMVLMVATFFAATGERVTRVAAAFDWDGWFAASHARVDAWVTPPAYTARPPMILTAAVGKDASAVSVLSVPVGSTLVVRGSGNKLDVTIAGSLTEGPLTEAAPKGASERHFTIAGDGTAQVRSFSGLPLWTFKTLPDRAPTIALAKDPERQAGGSLLLAYKIEDDYGVADAHAEFLMRNVDPPPADQTRNDKTTSDKAAPRPLFDLPQFALVLPNARTRNGVGQTVKDLSEHPYAGTDVTLKLTARDEAGNEGQSAPFAMRLPERVFAKPLPRALIELRRMLALDANQTSRVSSTLDALLIAPEVFTPEAGHYLGLRNVAAQLDHARTDDDLRETVASLWSLAVTIEDGNITDVDKALRAAQDALKQALERGASDEEIKKLTEQLRAALDNYMRQLAEQLKNNPQQLARPLDPNSRLIRQQDLNAMIERMERLSRSGDKDAAKQLLDQMQQMLENLQMARPGQAGDGDMDQALNELGDVIRKQQQLRDKTFKQGQDMRRDRLRGQQGDQNAMNDLRQDQQALRDRLKKLLDDLNKQGMGQGQRGDKGESAQKGQQGQQGQQQGQGDDDNGLDDADTAMGDADGRLGDGNANGAVDSQGRALDAMRKGAQKLAQEMQRQMGEGQNDGPGDRAGRQAGGGPDRDPLGRPLRGREHGDDFTVKIPGEIDVQRARRILEELRRRLGESQRPQIELDYIERLLKD